MTTGLLDKLSHLVRYFMSEHGPDYLWVPVSGGKDSAAAWSVVARATRDYVAVYIMIPGQTHADNVASVQSQARILGVRETITVKVDRTRDIRSKLEVAVSTCERPCLLQVLAFDTHGRDYWRAMKQYGFPAPLGRYGRGTRWCCGTFKHRVLQRLPYNGSRNGLSWKYGVNGVKATDSPYRARKYQNIVQTWERTKDTYLFPLLNLTDSQVWSLLEETKITSAVLPQYKKWGRSPNCMWCPLLGKKAAIQTIKAMPEGVRRLIQERLEELLPRYKSGTYSRKMITMWLSLLSLYVDDNHVSGSAGEGGEASESTGNVSVAGDAVN